MAEEKKAMEWIAGRGAIETALGCGGGRKTGRGECGGCCRGRFMEARGWILRLEVNLVNVRKLITGLSKHRRVVVGWLDRENKGRHIT